MNRIRWAFVIGAGVSLVLVARSQIGGDQWNLLARGWLLVERGVWTQHGNPTSAGGNEIGGFTTLLVALPLWLWRDHHAPTLLVWLTHVAAYLCLDSVIARAAGPRERWLFAVLYWLNPWRLYFSGHLWNPNFLFLAGGVHMGTAFAQRARPRFLSSFAHVAAIGLACQLHPSAIVLALASAALVWKRGMRLHPAGAALAVALMLASLVPWMITAAAEPSILPVGHGFVGRGLVTVYPLLFGLRDWLRYNTLAVASATPFDFTRLVGAGVEPWIGPFAGVIVTSVGVITFVPALLANVWFWRRVWRRRRSFDLRHASGRRWLEGYVVAMFAAACLAFCLAPTTVMYWQGFVLLHAAVMPAVLWLGALLRSRRAASIRVGVRAMAASSIAVVLLMAAGSPHYRCGGRGGVQIPLNESYPMIHELHVDDTCAVPIDADRGWAPDVFRPRR